MPTIVNPYRSERPVGEVFARLGQEMFGDQVGKAMKREQLSGLQFGNQQEREKAEARERAAAEWTTEGGPRVEQALAEYTRAGGDLDQVGKGLRIFAGNTFGARDPRTTNAVVGAGGPFSATADAFDLTLAEDRRKNDMAASTQRYGFDTQAATQRANNADDNRRAATTSLFGGLNEGQVRPAVPADITGAFGLPALPAATGRPKAPSETEWQAAQNERLRREGKLTDEQIVDGFTGQRQPVQALDPATGKPVFMSPGGAVRSGAQPIMDPGKQSPAQLYDAWIAKFPDDEAGAHKYAASGGQAPQTIVNTGDTADEKFYGEAGKLRAASFNNMADLSLDADRRSIKINRLEHLLSNVGTGGLARWRQIAGEYGINTGNLDDIQAAAALINSMVPDQRAPGSGTMSDADLQLFKESIPRIINQPEGNKLIIETMRGIAAYDAQVGDIANRVLDKQLTPAQGREELKSIKNPLERGTDAEPPAGISRAEWGAMSPEDKALFQ